MRVDLLAALVGFLLGLLIISHRVLHTETETIRPKTSSTNRSDDLGDKGAANRSVSKQTLGGTPSSSNQPVLAKLSEPISDPVVPPSSPEADAVLAFKYYLVSDDYDAVRSELDVVPEGQRDVVIRSGLYAVWERSESSSKYGDWFLGDTQDPYNSAETRIHHDVIHADVVPSDPATMKKHVDLAEQRIKEVYLILQRAEPATKAYWCPYLSMTMRRLGIQNRDLQSNIQKLGNEAIQANFKTDFVDVAIDQSWDVVKWFATIVFPLLLSAMGFVLTKVSQSSLVEVDRLVVKWLNLKAKPKGEGEKDKENPKSESDSEDAKEDVASEKGHE